MRCCIKWRYNDETRHIVIKFIESFNTIDRVIIYINGGVVNKGFPTFFTFAILWQVISSSIILDYVSTRLDCHTFFPIQDTPALESALAQDPIFYNKG
jgi:hypothetical protein